MVFNLTPSNGSCAYASLHDFTGGRGRNTLGNVMTRQKQQGLWHDV